MGLSKPIIIASESVDVSNLATKSDIDSIKNSVGAVKHIQRGTFSISTEVSLTLSGFENAEKMRVTLYGTQAEYSGSNYQFSKNVYPSSLTVDTLTVKSMVILGSSYSSWKNLSCTCAYEVTEYY